MRCICLILILFFFASLTAQQKLNNVLKSRLFNNELPARFDVLIKGNASDIRQGQKKLGIKVKYVANDIVCAEADRRSVINLSGATDMVDYVEYIEPPKSFSQLMFDSGLVKNDIKTLRYGAIPHERVFDGKNVIIGIIDTGIDFNHPDFKDKNGKSRILWLWDQGNKGTSPLPFSYGTEWTAAQIDKGLCTHSDKAYNGHGTFISGIVAGNGSGNILYQGIAPAAELIVVALDFKRPGATFADAIKYLIDKAELLKKPLVINISAGNYYGSHDATDLQSKLIEELISGKPGRVLVAAAGNAGNTKYHLKSTPGLDTVVTWLRKDGRVTEFSFYCDSSDTDKLNYAIAASKNGRDGDRTKFKSFGRAYDKIVIDTLMYNAKIIGYVQSFASLNSYGVFELTIRIVSDSTGYLWNFEGAGAGTFEAWNFQFDNRTAYYAQAGGRKKYIAPDSCSTVVSGFQCSREVITTGNYVDTLADNPFDQTARLAPNSGCGPTRTGEVKPDICAMGTGLVSAGLTNKNGAVYRMASGTSVASAIVAGTAALYLHANPSATNREVKNAIIRGAIRDEDTGDNLPDNKWGFGKISGLNTLNSVENSQYISAEVNDIVRWKSYTEKISIGLGMHREGTISIYNVAGVLIKQDNVQASDYVITDADIKESGIYYVKINYPARNYYFGIVK